MTKLNEIYRCPICGNIVEVTHAGAGELVCCGQPMLLQVENTTDAAIEKHIPVIEKTDQGIIVKIGEVAHPMTDEHYIEWIEITMKDGSVIKKILKPGDKPEMLVCDCGEGESCCEVESARAYCNLHGLWKK